MQLGTIVIIDAKLEELNSELLNNESFLHSLLEALTIVCGLTKVNECTHKFEPQGYTICHVLAESHISIHTWPENSECAIDIYSCKHDLDIEQIEKVLENYFKTVIKKNIQKFHRFI